MVTELMEGTLRGALLFFFGVYADMAIYKDYGSPPANNTDALPHVAGVNAHSQRGIGGILGDGLSSQYDYGKAPGLAAISVRYNETPVEYNGSANRIVPLGYLVSSREAALAAGELNLFIRISASFEGGEVPETLDVVFDGSSITASQDQTVDGGGVRTGGNQYLVITAEPAQTNEYVVSVDADFNLIITGGAGAEATVFTVGLISTADILANFDLSLPGFAHPANGKTLLTSKLSEATGADINAIELAYSSTNFPWSRPSFVDYPVVGGVHLAWVLTLWNTIQDNGEAAPFKARLENTPDPHGCENVAPVVSFDLIEDEPTNLTGNGGVLIGRLFALWGQAWNRASFDSLRIYMHGIERGANSGNKWAVPGYPVRRWLAQDDGTLVVKTDRFNGDHPTSPDFCAPSYPIFAERNNFIGSSYGYIRRIDSSAFPGQEACVNVWVPGPPNTFFESSDPWTMRPYDEAAETANPGADIVFLSDAEYWYWAGDILTNTGSVAWTSWIQCTPVP